MVRTYQLFEEIESDVAEKAPPVVYKYRTWKDSNHKALLVNQGAWFPHPFDLNDPLDVRPESVFIEEELYDPRYLQKMIASATHVHTERDRRAVAENHLEELKKNPGIIVENQKNWNEKRGNFDRYGVFSVAMNPLSEHLWKEYADNHAGFCLGFNTLELCRQMKSGFGYVNYSDEPYIFSFLDKKDDGLDVLYLKKDKWNVEEEFRFITMGIGLYAKRLQEFSPDIIKEVILGYDMLSDHEKEILTIIEKQYPKDLPVFKTKRDTSNKLTRVQIY